MATFICDISAFEYWFGERTSVRPPRALAAVGSFQHASSSWRDLPINQLGKLGLLSVPDKPLHLAVPEPRKMCHTRGLVTHLRNNPPPGTFVRLSRDVYIESPLAALIRLDRKSLTDGELVKRLYQLVAAFYLCDGKTVACEPLASMEDIHRFLAGATGMRGIKRVRALLPFVAPGAASMRECEVVTLLTLPPSIGGRGLPVPVLNHRIEPCRSAADIVRYADFFWAVARLILEYDSDKFHTGAEKIGLDALRRTQLQVEGYRVVTLTNYQLKHKAAYEDVLSELTRALGISAPATTVLDFDEREAKLRREVLGFDWIE